MNKTKFLNLTINLLLVLSSYAQGENFPSTTDCSTGGDFESGFLSTDWNARYGGGGSNNTLQNDALLSYVLDPNMSQIDFRCGANSTTRHYTIITNGFDPILSNLPSPVQLPMTHNNSGHSLRLGNSCVSVGKEAISKRYNVTSNNSTLSFWYSAVQSTPASHGNAMPVFGVRIFVGNSTNCVENEVNLTGNGLGYIISQANSPFYNNAGTIMYTGWKCANIDLSQYIGEIITVEFYNIDCLAGGHFGYVYLDDISCTPIEGCDVDGQVRNLVQNSCDRFCFEYSLPRVNGGIASAVFTLKNYDIYGRLINTFTSTSITGNNTNFNSYCFNNINGKENGRVEIESEYTIVLNGQQFVWNNIVVLVENITVCGVPCCKEENIFSTTKQGYNRSVPVISANNSKHLEVDFCSFEENNFDLSKTLPQEDLYDGLIPKLSATNLNTEKRNSHTGTYSLKLDGQNNYSVDFAICEDDNTNYEYIFNPILEKEYRLNFWIKSKDEYLSSVNPDVLDIKFYDATNTQVGSNISNGVLRTEKIEGWQLYELHFSIPKNISSVSIDFKGKTGEVRYFDDIRITPLNSTAKSYVYDEKNLRLIAELDENHFTTFYDYDEDGNLIRLRKETEKGIVTLKEMNVNFQK